MKWKRSLIRATLQGNLFKQKTALWAVFCYSRISLLIGCRMVRFGKINVPMTKIQEDPLVSFNYDTGKIIEHSSLFPPEFLVSAEMTLALVSSAAKIKIRNIFEPNGQKRLSIDCRRAWLGLLFEEFPHFKSSIADLVPSDFSTDRILDDHNRRLRSNDISYKLFFTDCKERHSAASEKIKQAQREARVVSIVKKTPYLSKNAEMIALENIDLQQYGFHEVDPDDTAELLFLIFERSLGEKNVKKRLCSRERRFPTPHLRKMFWAIMCTLYLEKKEEVEERKKNGSPRPKHKISLSKAGAYLRNNHATVLHALKKHEDLLQTNKRYTRKFLIVQNALLACKDQLVFMKTFFSFKEVATILDSNNVSVDALYERSFVNSILQRSEFSFGDLVELLRNKGVEHPVFT